MELKEVRCRHIKDKTGKTCNAILFKYEGELTNRIQKKCFNCKKIVEINKK